MAKDTYYFSHDYNARQDPKIKKLISKHSLSGYGIFWAIIEDLYNNANALPTDYESIAFDLRTDCDTIKSIICDFDLFKFKDGLFGSVSVERRLNERNAKSKKARESALKRWSECERNANALPTQSEPNAIKESIGNEMKEKGESEKKMRTPTQVEVEKFFVDCGAKKSQGTKFFQHYHGFTGFKGIYDWTSLAQKWILTDHEKNGTQTKETW